MFEIFYNSFYFLNVMKVFLKRIWLLNNFFEEGNIRNKYVFIKNK